MAEMQLDTSVSTVYKQPPRILSVDIGGHLMTAGTASKLELAQAVIRLAVAAMECVRLV